MNRRDFVLLTAAGVVCAHEVAHATDPSAKTDSSNKTVDIGTLSDYRTDGLSDRFLKSHKMWIFRDRGRLYAFTAVCSHRACLVKAGGPDGLACPCHGSRYTPDGAVTKGPAQTSLLHFAIAMKDDRIIVDMGTTYREAHWDDDGASIAAG